MKYATERGTMKHKAAEKAAPTAIPNCRRGQKNHRRNPETPGAFKPRTPDSGGQPFERQDCARLKSQMF
ncbi:MAG: hypothetical protein DYH07_11190 [Armatimonadetes bacterium ATM1]|nr:MAG: hypothetical protein EDM73_11350 [Armatimonadota bacterium]MBC6970238.1 hypothetical protein [Armatimonadota bacterium]MCE7900640.1 hypothetical protein [Armatimonadetes bacterium ATM1]RIJ97181.1 MAG: hypothetical protein DCC45_03855 [Armatimonadota bacterium]